MTTPDTGAVRVLDVRGVPWPLFLTRVQVAIEVIPRDGLLDVWVSHPGSMLEVQAWASRHKAAVVDAQRRILDADGRSTFIHRLRRLG